MFYCNACAVEKEWPAGFTVSIGKCEVCGKTVHCYDVPSKHLPKPTTPVTPEPYQLDLSSLIGAYASACVDSASAMLTGLEAEGAEADRVQTELQLELHRRIALAQADRSIHWKSHMNNDPASRKRQRFLISFAAMSPGHRERQRAAEHARVWPLDTPEEAK